MFVFSNSNLWAKEVKPRKDLHRKCESEPPALMFTPPRPFASQDGQFLLAPRAVPAARFPGLLPVGRTADAGARTLGENGRCLGPRGAWG